MKLLHSLKEAIQQSGLKDGMVISFHHHLRNGDHVLNMVMEQIASMGIGDLTINASAIQDVHEPLIQHIKNGVVSGLETNYMAPTVGRAIAEGILPRPLLFRTHGGRPSDIERGDSQIDVAFIAAPASDPMGNCTGKLGKSACGSLGYAFADARHARKVVVITDHLVSYPLTERSISEADVDYVVQVESIGDPAGIISGTTRMPKDPVALKIAEYGAKLIEGSGYLKDGFNFQTGAGGAPLAIARFLKEIMLQKQIRGGFALGGITGYLVDMLKEGCFQAIQDVQCFDLHAVESIRSNPAHCEITASEYAGTNAKSCAADELDVVVLGAAQIDREFNVNVHTDSNGRIIGGSGGHSDVAARAKMTVVAAPLNRARISTLVPRVLTRTTPGSSVDVFLSQYGAAIHPRRTDLQERLKKSKIPMFSMEELLHISEKLNGRAEEITLDKSRVIAEVRYFDGSTIDRIYARG